MPMMIFDKKKCIVHYILQLIKQNGAFLFIAGDHTPQPLFFKKEKIKRL